MFNVTVLSFLSALSFNTNNIFRWRINGIYEMFYYVGYIDNLFVFGKEHVFAIGNILKIG